MLEFEAQVVSTLCRAQSKGGLREPWSNTGNGYFMACTYLLNEEFEIKLSQVVESHLEAHRDRSLLANPAVARCNCSY